MSERVQKFFKKHNINTAQIMYVYRDEKKTLVHVADKRDLGTFIPVKNVAEELPEDVFISINKGVVLNKKYIKSINKGLYCMADGMVFKGRVRTAGEHKHNSEKLSVDRRYNVNTYKIPAWSRFSLFDKLPIPYCMMEIKDMDKSVVDFTICYCNPAFEKLEGVEMAEIVGRSGYELFAIDAKWSVLSNDVAVYGQPVTIDDYPSITGKKVKLMAYQVETGFVGILVLPKA